MSNATRPAEGLVVDPERTLGQLVSEATGDVQAILRAEVALAKAELKDDVTKGAVAGGMFGAAGYLALVGSILLFIAAAYGLTATGLPNWAAFLILAVVLFLLAGILALVGKGRISRIKPPERAIRSSQATIAAIKPGSARKA